MDQKTELDRTLRELGLHERPALFVCSTCGHSEYFASGAVGQYFEICSSEPRDMVIEGKLVFDWVCPGKMVFVREQMEQK